MHSESLSLIVMGIFVYSERTSIKHASSLASKALIYGVKETDSCFHEERYNPDGKGYEVRERKDPFKSSFNQVSQGSSPKNISWKFSL